MPDKSVIEDGIRWERMERERFDAMVDALLARLHDEPDHIEFPDGRGGDEGCDAIVVTADRRTIVYQYKFFVDGLSTSGSSRKTQIQRSFKSALASIHRSNWRGEVIWRVGA